jgi:hypothetical protein
LNGGRMIVYGERPVIAPASASSHGTIACFFVLHFLCVPER